MTPTSSSVHEEVLDPSIAICDAHHHLWEHIAPPYLVPDLMADLQSGPRVASTVYVECSSSYRTGGPPELRPVGETEWVAATTDGRPVAAGIVGFVDLTLGDAVDYVIAAHVAAGRGRFRGVRHATAWDPSDDVPNGHHGAPPGLLHEAAFQRGLAAVGVMGLTFDAWLYVPQLSELVELARRLPEVTIVLDHLGGPVGIGPYAGRRNEILDTLRVGLREVAGCPNVHLKLGGIGMSCTAWGGVVGSGHRRRARLPKHGLRSCDGASTSSGPTGACSRATFPSTGGR